MTETERAILQAALQLVREDTGEPFDRDWEEAYERLVQAADAHFAAHGKMEIASDE